MSVVVDTISTDYIRVAANITDTNSDIRNAYAFALVTPLTSEEEADTSTIDTFILDNLSNITVLSDPNTGATERLLSEGAPFHVIGFVRKAFSSLSSPDPLEDVTSGHHVYIFTKNNVGYKKVWKTV